MCFLNGDKKRSNGEGRGRSAWDLPNVPGQMFASAEDHTTLAITTTLKGLCGCGAVALCDACRVWRGGEEGRVVWGDEGGHVVVSGRVDMRGGFDVVFVEGCRF